MLGKGRGTYGTRRLKHLLAQEGLHVSRRRSGRILAQAGLRGKTRRKFKAPTAAGQAQTVAPHQLNRELMVTKTRYRLRGGYDVSSDGRRLAVPRRRPGSLLAGGGRLVDGQP